MLEHRITAIPALKDNYIWAITRDDTTKLTIVDPGEAAPVIAYIDKHKLELSNVLITHHHPDHTGGIPKLSKLYDFQLYHAKNLSEGQTLLLQDIELSLKVMHVPGHTLDHCAFVNDDMVFSGDTLFAAGCGKVFEGTHQQMFDSLARFKSLPPETKVYPGHEYTLKNLEFCASRAPGNTAIEQRLAKVRELRQTKQVTLPSTIAEELATNLFLQAQDVASFTELRKAKDAF